MPDLDIGPFTILSYCIPIPHFTWVWLRHSVAWLVYFSPKPPHPLSKQVKLFNIFRKELSLHFQHLSIPVMLFLINKVQKEYPAVIRAVRITRFQYIREAVTKNGIFRNNCGLIFFGSQFLSTWLLPKFRKGSCLLFWSSCSGWPRHKVEREGDLRGQVVHRRCQHCQLCLGGGPSLWKSPRLK